MIHSTCRNSSRLFIQSFEGGDDDPKRNYFDKYYMPSVEIKEFNVLINNRPFSSYP